MNIAAIAERINNRDIDLSTPGIEDLNTIIEKKIIEYYTYTKSPSLTAEGHKCLIPMMIAECLEMGYEIGFCVGKHQERQRRPGR